MRSYSPFDTPLSQLRAADLRVLCGVAEGWHVEYKSRLPNARVLAKSISAFANTYGGWLFVGVEEKAKSEPIANSFPGLTSETVDSQAQRIPHAVAAHLNPTCFFEMRILRGPSVEVDLAEGKAIIVIEVPESVTAPHIHSDGRIYRRVADGSEPKPETDRFLLDQLRARSEPTTEVVRDWVRRDPEFSEAESSAPYLRLLFCPDPWLRRWPERALSSSDVRDVLNAVRPNVASAPFDTVYTAGGHVIARQVAGNDPHLYGLTWRIGPSMACDCVIPLPACSGDLAALEGFLHGYENAQRFLNLLGAAGYVTPQVADLNFVASLLESCVAQYRQLLVRAGLPLSEFHYKIRLLNAWRVCAFVDHDAVLSSYEEHGLPLVLESTSTFPLGDGPASFGEIPTSTTDDSDLGEPDLQETLAVKLQGAVLCEFVHRAFGAPGVVGADDGTSEDGGFFYLELLELRERALQVQLKRRARR